MSAIADEAAGVENSLESLDTGATDPTCFDAEWIAAVRETFAAARAATAMVRSKAPDLCVPVAQPGRFV